MAFDEDAVVVTGLEPGGTVVFFSVARSVGSYVPRTTSRADLLAEDADGKDGEVRIPLEGGVPAKFFAVAVEMASGRHAVLMPEGRPAREIAFPADGFGEGLGRRFDRLEDAGDLAMFLLVRPGVGGGAWSLATGDGASSDEGQPNDGLILTSASALQPIGKSGPPPEEYEKDDLLVRIAPRAGTYYATRVVR
jgi:hypothetical protein